MPDDTYLESIGYTCSLSTASATQRDTWQICNTVEHMHCLNLLIDNNLRLRGSQYFHGNDYEYGCDFDSYSLVIKQV